MPFPIKASEQELKLFGSQYLKFASLFVSIEELQQK